MIDMKEVLDVIGSSDNVYYALRSSYEKPSHSYRLRRTVNRGAPLYTSELYLMILKEKRIPSAEEFSEDFVTSFFPRGDRDSAKMQAKYAYKALLTDIHFYFQLLESKLFDKVEMSFSHDIFAKSDVLVVKNGVPIGLQLFSGDEAYVKTKSISLERIKHRLSYRLYAMPLKLRENHLDASDNPMSLYEKEDVQEVLGLFSREVDIVEEKLKPESDVDRFVMLPRRQEAITAIEEAGKPRKVLASHSVIFGGKMDSAEFESLRRDGVEVHHIPVDVPGITPFRVIDGDALSLRGKEEYLKRHGHLSSRFNYNQYVVEHADPEQHIAINASAGSGKTTTLIARIMYLLDMGLVDGLDQIAMITFTNEAANNMEESLAKRLIQRFKLTGDPIYMKHINDLRRMDILTIPSFGKSILTRFGQYLGFGSGFRVSKMTMERRRMIERMFEEVLHEKAVENPFDGMWYFEAREFLESVWDKFEQKGVISDDLSKMKMCESESDFTKSVIEILKKSDEELFRFKIENDTIGISDLTRFMKLIRENGAPIEELSDRYRYLFVDEFQDTDISQIQSIVSIIAATNIRLIAVGDVKQGIYRFRGADSSAFNVLDKMMNHHGLDQPVTYRLDENFRSSERLVVRMEDHFSAWRRSPLKLLPEGEGRMISRKKTDQSGECLFLKNDQIDMDEIKMRLDEVSRGDESKGNKVLAILVRRNGEAKKIGDMIRGDGRIKNFEVRMNGTLFESAAARDLLILINSWVYPERRDALHALSETAYAKTDNSHPQMFELVNEKRLSATNTSLSLHESWRESRERLKFSPLLPVIDSFIEKSNYKAHLREKEVSEVDITQYELNLHKIMMSIHETFADEPIDILTLHEWLEMQVATNREADEAELDDASFDGNPVRVLTVHRAKGLQFDTVLIPYTTNAIVRRGDGDVNDTIVHVSSTGKIEFAWRRVKHVKNKKVIDFKTSQYESLRTGENEEQLREETRLLYVAMTRAEERLFIYEMDDKRQTGNEPNTWKDLLKMARRS